MRAVQPSSYRDVAVMPTAPAGTNEDRLSQPVTEMPWRESDKPVLQSLTGNVAQAVRPFPSWGNRPCDDKPSIGLVFCKTRDRVIAEYALRNINKPIGVAEWQTQLVQSLPEPLRSNLPTIEQIEEVLGGGK